MFQSSLSPHHLQAPSTLRSLLKAITPTRPTLLNWRLGMLYLGHEREYSGLTSFLNTCFQVRQSVKPKSTDFSERLSVAFLSCVWSCFLNSYCHLVEKEVLTARCRPQKWKFSTFSYLCSTNHSTLPESKRLFFLWKYRTWKIIGTA